MNNEANNKRKIDPKGYLVALISGIFVYFILESFFRAHPGLLPLLTQIWYERLGHEMNYAALWIAIVAGAMAGYFYEKSTGTSVDNWGGPSGV